MTTVVAYAYFRPGLLFNTNADLSIHELAFLGIEDDNSATNAIFFDVELGLILKVEHDEDFFAFSVAE